MFSEKYVSLSNFATDNFQHEIRCLLFPPPVLTRYCNFACYFCCHRPSW